MIPKSALSALTGLIELAENGGPWKCGEPLLVHDVNILQDLQAALPALRSLLEPTEARAEPASAQACHICGCYVIGPPAASPLPKAETQEAVSDPVAYYLPPGEGRREMVVLASHYSKPSEYPDALDGWLEKGWIPLAHPSPQPEAATIDAESAADGICNMLKFKIHGMDVQWIGPKRDALKESIAAIIRKHASEHAGEQGWVRVPREPTEAMMKAAYAAQGGVNNQIRAAIAAAPDSAGGKK